ncbi:MAG TPA: gamma-glutamyl-gamma-aminobutyrate hydrolase family protein [Microbacteriaceae bacterium]|nr:gamma-glutamyl-gamma-aminobutyrate hydrolase family protein [Microbacteriaceae bacterium]
MSRPLIGISGRKLLGHQLDMPAGFADAPLDLYFSEYADSVAQAGGLPIHLSPAGGPGIIKHLDALVIAGGEDVDSRRYGEAPGPHSGPYSVERDEFEFSLVEKAIEQGIPILGVCRGHQLINVAFGGSLIQHLEIGEGESHAALTYYRKHKSHTVAITKDSVLGRIYGENIKVNSYHHQAVKEPGKGVVPIAWAEDGVIEGFEVEDRPIIGVQWHPECFENDPIFEWLVSSAKKG